MGVVSRRDNLDRCSACRLHTTLCICALVPALAPRTRLALLVHAREVGKPTNTGQLAARCLATSSVTVIGLRDQAPVLPVVESHEQGLLLYPADDAVSIEAYAGKPVVLFVPDGSWRQAHKMRRRVPGLAALPCVTLPELAPTTYRLRHEPQEGGLATLEAIARALHILEGDVAIETALLDIFRVMVDRTLWMRGQLGDAQVTGGLPEAAREANPRGTPARHRTR